MRSNMIGLLAEFNLCIIGLYHILNQLLFLWTVTHLPNIKFFDEKKAFFIDHENLKLFLRFLTLDSHLECKKYM